MKKQTPPDNTEDNKNPKSKIAPGKPKKLTYRQKAFISQYALTGNATKSAKLAGYTGTSDSLASTGSRLLSIDEIRTGVDLLAGKAVNRISTIITEGKEHNALQASMYILDQKLGKARQSVDVTSNVLTVTLDLSGGAYGDAPSDAPTPVTDDSSTTSK